MLTGTCVGQAATNTRKKLKEATGGIFSLDEAYGLNANSFGREAIDMVSAGFFYSAPFAAPNYCLISPLLRQKLVKLIDVDTPKPDDPVVFFAGYADKMALFMKHKSGMGRRIQHKFRFEAYTAEQIATIFVKLATEKENNVLGAGLDLGYVTEKVGEMDAAWRGENNGGVATALFRLAYAARDARLNPYSDVPISAEEFKLLRKSDLDSAFDALAEEIAEEAAATAANFPAAATFTVYSAEDTEEMEEMEEEGGKILGKRQRSGNEENEWNVSRAKRPIIDLTVL
jgi:hypothetical protein